MFWGHSNKEHRTLIQWHYILVGKRKREIIGPETAVSMARAQLVKGTLFQMGWRGMQRLDYVQPHRAWYGI